MTRPLPITVECADCQARAEHPTADELEAFLRAHYRTTIKEPRPR